MPRFSWNQYGLKMIMKNLPKNYINNNMIIEGFAIYIDNVEFSISNTNTFIFDDDDKSVFFKDLELKKVIPKIKGTHYTIDRIKVKVSNDKNIYIFFNGYINIETIPFNRYINIETMPEIDKRPLINYSINSYNMSEEEAYEDVKRIINLYINNINKINIKDNFVELGKNGENTKTISTKIDYEKPSFTHGTLSVDNGYLNPKTSRIIIDNLIIFATIVDESQRKQIDPPKTEAERLGNSLYRIDMLSFDF